MFFIMTFPSKQEANATEGARHKCEPRCFIAPYHGAVLAAIFPCFECGRLVNFALIYSVFGGDFSAYP